MTELAVPEQADLRDQVAALVPDLRAFARFLAGDRAGADDLVQDTIVRALGAQDQFIAGASLRAWLFAILRNTFYEQSRRRRTEARLLAEATTDTLSHPAAQHGQAALAELQRFLLLLPTPLREALVLVGAHGLSHAEAARVCNVAEGTMKARVSRARAELAKRMLRA
jgi:RNA polymerase sigma-70 factor (ECF subfamily)